MTHILAPCHVERSVFQTGCTVRKRCFRASRTYSIHILPARTCIIIIFDSGGMWRLREHALTPSYDSPDRPADIDVISLTSTTNAINRTSPQILPGCSVPPQITSPCAPAPPRPPTSPAYRLGMEPPQPFSIPANCAPSPSPAAHASPQHRALPPRPRCRSPMYSAPACRLEGCFARCRCLSLCTNYFARINPVTLFYYVPTRSPLPLIAYSARPANLNA
jgi:hypothetical protein